MSNEEVEKRIREIREGPYERGDMSRIASLRLHGLKEIKEEEKKPPVFLLMRKRTTLNVFWNEEKAKEKMEEEIEREFANYSDGYISPFSIFWRGQISKKYSVEEFQPW